MKRFVAILLILVLVFALSATAFAAGAVVSPEKNNTDTTVTPEGHDLSADRRVLQHPVGDPCGHRSGRSGAVLRQKADSRQVNRRSHG